MTTQARSFSVGSHSPRRALPLGLVEQAAVRVEGQAGVEPDVAVEAHLAAFSPDGRWELGLQEAKSGQRIAIYPVGPGESRFLPLGGLHAEGAFWCPDGERIVFFGFEGGHGRRLYVIDSVEGKPRAISPEGHTGSGVFTRDGKATLGYDAERRIWVYPLDGVQYFAITPDWSAYAYGYLWRQSDVFVAEGLR